MQLQTTRADSPTARAVSAACTTTTVIAKSTAFATTMVSAVDVHSLLTLDETPKYLRPINTGNLWGSLLYISIAL